ncbi:flagellar biosynthesis regulator FlaF [Breoghania sp.]|uniref:flagellar biosynthesis regulator FlaF n=1 Tax=Breoghania sp. TaxID=2065378 RepID=UPI002AA9476D|nr:flagellar biosynthesis regulator FlaF [Breoghania sp.]
MYNQAAAAYQKMSQTGVNPRDLEATLLMKAAGKLQNIVDHWEEMTPADLTEQLTYNRRLWTYLLAAVSESENPLPDQIKTNITNLGVFILNRTLEVMREPNAQRLASLISINRNIAEGLRGRG